MHSCAGDTLLSITTVELQHEEKIAELRGTIGSDGTIVLSGWVLEGLQLKLGGGVRWIPGHEDEAWQLLKIM